MASYIDTSFMYKLYVNEDQSDQAVNWFHTYPNDVVISDLTDVEMTSSLYRSLPRERAASAHSIYEGDKILGVYVRLPIDHSVFALASELALQYAGVYGLRSLDALHLAAALHHGVNTLATFDIRLQKAARAAGMRIVDITM